MNIEFGVLNDGRLTLASDGPLPDIVKRVEYYREQQLFMLVYDNDNACDSDGSELMECEVPSHLAAPIEKSPNIVIFTLFDGHDPLAYKVPLIKVGNVF